MPRCQKCQMKHATVGTCKCGKIICLPCSTSFGCCGKIPAELRYHIVEGNPITEANDKPVEVDEDGDEILDPTDELRTDPNKSQTEHKPELGGES